MKNSKFVKIISLLLSCLFIMAAFSGVLSFAEGEEGGADAAAATVSIKYKNVSYDDSIRLVYYVESAGLADGQSVKMILSDSPIEAVAIDESTKLVSSFGKLTVGAGEDAAQYDGFVSEDIIPAELRLNTYAVAVVVDADNNIVAQSEVLEYSVFNYCMDRLEKGSTADQQALYTALLNFGASVQEVLLANNDTLTIDSLGGWANEYYGIKINTSFEGSVVASQKYYYSADQINKDQTVSVDRLVNIGNTAARFSAVTQDKGMTVSASGTNVTFAVRGKVGFSNINCIYNKGLSYESFAGTKLPKYLKGSRFGTSIAADAASGIGEWLIKDGDSSYLHVEKRLAGSSNDFRISMNEMKQDGATKYIVEYDYRWNGASAIDQSADSKSYVMYVKINNSDGKQQAEISCTADANTPIKYGSQSINIGEWVSVRVEFDMIEDGKWNVTTYINDVVTDSKKSVASSGVPQIHFETRWHGGYAMSMDFDNFFVSAE